MFALLICLLLAVCVIFQATAEGQGEEEEGPITLTFWTHMSEFHRDTFAEIFESYTQANPNVSVKIEYVSGGWDDVQKKLLTSVSADIPMDVIYVDGGQVGQFSERGIVINLDEYIANDSDIDLDDYYPGALNLVRHEGSLHVLPITQAIQGLYYNLDLFSEAGIGGPPATFIEIQRDAKKLTDSSMDQWGVHLRHLDPTSPQVNRLTSFSNFIFPNGGRFLNDAQDKVAINSPEAKEAIQVVLDMIYKDKVHPLPGSVGDEAWMSGKAAMRYEWLYLVNMTKNNAPDLNYKVARLPAGKAGSTSQIGGHAVGVVSTSEHKQASYDLISWLTAAEQDLQYAKTINLLPANITAGKDPYYQDHHAWKGYIDQLQFCIIPNPTAPKWPEVQRYMASVLDDALYDRRGLAEVLAEIEVEGNKIFAE